MQPIKSDSHQHNFLKMGHKNGVRKDIAKLLVDHNQGIKLDIGCGENKNPGFVGMDIRPGAGVDIVQNLEKFPWPLPDECVSIAVASHVVEHIDPHNFVFVNFMNEVWRVLKVGGRFAISVPYAGSPGYWQDPTHCNPCNETTFHYFDPLSSFGLYNIYRPKPWKIVEGSLTWHVAGNLEVLLEKRRIDKSYRVAM